MEDEYIEKRVLCLKEVEKLSMRQIASLLSISRGRVTRILNGKGVSTKYPPKVSILEPYRALIANWYREYPRLTARQIYERLLPYEYTGSYPSVARFSMEYRRVKKEAYHTLSFLPGEEAQIDWFFFKHDSLGTVAGFLYVLSYSRYAWGMFYPKTSFEFFLAGHIECFNHIGGLARRHRYDNLKSVVLARHPVLQYNPRFLDFSRFYGFSIHLCNPYRGNEKGRVERIIRDIRGFLYGKTFSSTEELNTEFRAWLILRNEAIHRSTGKSPKELLGKERLISLPHTPYPAKRDLGAIHIPKTALVEFETNKYSVPAAYVGKTAHVAAYPERIEIWIDSNRTAVHKRSFERNKLIQNPLHSEKLLDKTRHFKMKRILQLIQGMSLDFNQFLIQQENDTERMEAAYQLFILLKTHSKAMLASAVRELNGMNCFKIKALRSLLSLPEDRDPDLVWPRDSKLLNINYKERSLEDYDPNN